MPDYYEILGVSKDASQDEIKKQYKHLAQKYHPDRSEDPDANKKFQEISEAYNTLKDPQKRKEYDNPQQHRTFRTGDPGFGRWKRNGNSFTSMDDILREFMKNHAGADYFSYSDAFGGRSRERERRYQTARIQISLEEAYTGTTRTLNGKEFNIPKGVRSGNKLLVDDFILIVEVAKHPKFKRANDDLLVRVNITAIEAMTGVECTVKGIDGSTIKFGVPKGVQPEQTIRLRGKGMPNPEVPHTGDLHIQVGITIPDDLTDDQLSSIMALPNRKTIDI